MVEVIVYKNSEFYGIYDSQTKAGRAIGIPPERISYACSKIGKQYGEYYFYPYDLEKNHIDKFHEKVLGFTRN